MGHNSGNDKKKTAETLPGVTLGKRKGDRETWWWNEEVQESIKKKKEAKKAWDKIRNEKRKKMYKDKKSKAKKTVAMAKGCAYDNLYARLETKKGEKELYCGDEARGEVCSRNYRKLQNQGRTAPGISVKSVSVCSDYGQNNGGSKERTTVEDALADNIAICEETRKEVEQRIESMHWKECIGKCRYALKRRGMKVSRSKTEYLCVNGGNDKETVKTDDTKVPRVKEFKYLGSTVQESGSCEREVKKRVQAGWNRWRKVSEEICDRLPARVKGKVYSSVVRPAMVYGLETVVVTKNKWKRWKLQR